MEPAINPNAYQEALLRARQLAAKLTGGSKRPLEEDSPPPDAKRPPSISNQVPSPSAAISDPIGAQLASIKQQTLTKPSKNMLYLNGVVMNGEKTLDIMIPGNKVGYVIGKGGEMIRNLQERAGVKMTVFQDTNEVSSTEKQLRIIGEVDKVDYARQLVTDLLTEKEIETIRMKSGGPPGGNKTMTNDYGTMRGGNTVEVPVSPQYIGLVIGKGGENIRRIQQESNAKVQFDTTKSDVNGNKLCIISGSPDSVNRAVDMVKEIIDMGMRGKKPMLGGEETRIGVPAYKTGTVIGRGGETIRSLKQQCGCDIELDKGSKVDDDPEQKYFIIRGPPEKVSYATQLIQERVGTITTSSGGAGGMSYNELSQQWTNYWQNSDSHSNNSQATQQEAPSQDNNAAWAAYYAQYYAQFNQTGQPANGSAPNPQQPSGGDSNPGQPEGEHDQALVAQKWAEYYRAYGMHKEADHYEQMAKSLKTQQSGDGNHSEKQESSSSTSAAPVSYPGYNYSAYQHAPQHQQHQQQGHQPPHHNQHNQHH